MQELISDDAIRAIAALAENGTAPKLITIEGGTHPMALIPNGTKLESLAGLVYNEHNPRPERLKANVSVLDPQSFIEYFGKFKTDSSRIFAYEPERTVTAILDYHEGPLAPAWTQHRLTLNLRESEEWKIWTGSNGKPKSQSEFAEFLEQYSTDIVSPDPAHMMDVARDLEATTEVEFGSATRMQDGQVRLKYTETVKATVGAGKLDVPERFMLHVPVFVGGPRINMEALLRFRVREGKLSLHYTLIRPDEVLRQAFQAARDEIAAALDLAIINGKP